MKNEITAIAASDNRDYITPEDIVQAFENGIDETKIKLDVLQVLGGATGFYCEDSDLCASVATLGLKTKVNIWEICTSWATNKIVKVMEFNSHEVAKEFIKDFNLKNRPTAEFFHYKTAALAPKIYK